MTFSSSSLMALSCISLTSSTERLMRSSALFTASATECCETSLFIVQLFKKRIGVFTLSCFLLRFSGKRGEFFMNDLIQKINLLLIDFNFQLLVIGLNVRHIF